MSIKDMPQVTVEQVLELRKAAIELEKELNKYKAHMVILEKDVQDLCFVELDLILTKKELATIKASLPKIKAEAVLSLIEAIEGAIDNDFISIKEVEEMHLEDFCELAKRHANKLEVGE